MLSKSNRLIGAILLVSGTTIGAGMLALPVTTGRAGFFPSLLLMLLVFLFMMMTALYLLEVNLRMKGESNIISMVKKSLGRSGEVVAWISYLLLLYSLTAAYLVGCSQILNDFFNNALPLYLGPVLVFLIFGTFVYFGTVVADFLNRFLMIGLFVSYALLISLGIFHINFSYLTHTNFFCLIGALPVVVTSFGYHIIIPTLTEYLEHDAARLKKAIVIGSLIPFVIYLLWQFLAMGVLPVEGECSLSTAEKLGEQVTFYLKKIIGSPLISLSARFFAFFAIVTSLIGVTLSLSDFLSDGLKIQKSHKGKLFLILLTFLPPLFFALFYPKGFILALKYAGIFVVILLALLPTLMAFQMRRKKKEPLSYKVFGGNKLLIVMMSISFLLLVIEIVS